VTIFFDASAVIEIFAFFETFRVPECALGMKMMTLPVLCFGLLSIGTCNPYAIDGSGNSKTESRAVASFSKIDLAGSPDVDVVIGPTTSVAVSADDNLLPFIETTVDGETLKIKSKHSYRTRLGVTVSVTVPSLHGASVSGSGNIHVAGLKVGALDATVAGSGNVTLAGAVDQLRARIVGSGDVQAGNLAAKNVRVSVTGSGDALIRATDELDASVTGSGNVRYSGAPPRQVRKHVTGSGDIGPG
jgi:hypothetical protein